MSEHIEHDFKGIWIPRAMLDDPDLKGHERMLLAEIDALDNGEGCWARDAHLAERMGVTEGRLKNKIVDLKKRGFLSTIHRTKTHRYLRTKFSRHCQKGDFKSNENVTFKVTKTLPPLTRENKERTKRKTPSVPDGEKGFGVGEDETWAMDLSIKFLNWASRNRKTVGKRKPDVKKWAKEIDDLLASEDISQLRFKTALLWYLDHHKDDFVPQCETVKTFCERFAKVSAARDRWLKSEGEPLDAEERKPIEKTHHADGTWTD